MVVQAFKINFLLGESTRESEFFVTDIDSIESQTSERIYMLVQGRIKADYIETIGKTLGLSHEHFGRTHSFLVSQTDSGDPLIDDKYQVALPCPPFCSLKGGGDKNTVYP